MLAITWAMFALMAAAFGVLATGLFSLRSRIDAQGDALGARIDAQGDALGARIDAQGEALGARIDAQGDALGARIDALGARIDGQTARIDDLAKTMHEGFRDVDRRMTAAGA